MSTPPRKVKEEPKYKPRNQFVPHGWRTEYQQPSTGPANTAAARRAEAILAAKYNDNTNEEVNVKYTHPRRATRHNKPPKVHRKGTRSRLTNNERKEINEGNQSGGRKRSNRTRRR
jgi:hypothetical protein